MKIKELKCPNCGANLVPKSPSDKIIMCNYCGTVVYIEEEDKKVVYVDGVTQKERGETELAIIALRSRNFADAKKKFEAAISNNIKNNVAWLGKAAADVNLGNLNESILAFKKAMEIGSPPDTIISWGNYLIGTAAYYESTYYSYSRIPEQTYMGNAQKYLEYSRAYGNYRQAVQNVMYEYLLGILSSGEQSKDKQLTGYALQLAMGSGDYENMYTLADGILAENSDSPLGRYYKGVAALYLGKPHEAIDLLQPLLQDMPNNYNVYVFLAYAYSRTGHYEYACELLFSGYTRLRNNAIIAALSNIYGKWYNQDSWAAKNWKHARKKDLKAWGISI